MGRPVLPDPLCKRFPAGDWIRRARWIWVARSGTVHLELSRWADEVVGIDLSHRFIAAANSVRQTGQIEITDGRGRSVDPARAGIAEQLRREKCRFEIGDATDLPADIGKFDVVLAANLIDRVEAPGKLLESFSELIHPGGHLILSSPYTWLDKLPKIRLARRPVRPRPARRRSTLDGIEETVGRQRSIID